MNKGYKTLDDYYKDHPEEHQKAKKRNLEIHNRVQRLKNDSSHKKLPPCPECNHLTLQCECRSKYPTDEVSKENLERLQAHFNHCNSVDCKICQLFGEGVNKLANAVEIMLKTTVTIKEMPVEELWNGDEKK